MSAQRYALLCIGMMIPLVVYAPPKIKTPPKKKTTATSVSGKQAIQEVQSRQKLIAGGGSYKNASTSSTLPISPKSFSERDFEAFL